MQKTQIPQSWCAKWRHHDSQLHSQYSRWPEHRTSSQQAVLSNSLSTMQPKETQNSTAPSEKLFYKNNMILMPRTSYSQKLATRFRRLQNWSGGWLATPVRVALVTRHSASFRSAPQLQVACSENRKHTFMQHVHPKFRFHLADLFLT